MGDSYLHVKQSNPFHAICFLFSGGTKISGSTKIDQWHKMRKVFSIKLLEQVQGSTTIGVRRVITYAYFYWRTHNFGHVYADKDAHFSL